MAALASETILNMYFSSFKNVPSCDASHSLWIIKILDKLL